MAPDLPAVRAVLLATGIAPLPAGLIRNTCGARRLGRRVRDKIAEGLAEYLPARFSVAWHAVVVTIRMPTR